jgi:hypothetical protein
MNGYLIPLNTNKEASIRLLFVTYKPVGKTYLKDTRD